MSSKNNQELRPLVRVLTEDLEGNKHAVIALTKIKGVSYMLSNAVLRSLSLPVNKKIGFFTEEEIQRVEEAIKDPASAGIPSWMFNRRKDLETGKDLHLIGADLNFTKENDIKLLRKIKSYRGLRLSWGLTVRGQRTRSNFRNKKKLLGKKRK